MLKTNDKRWLALAERQPQAAPGTPRRHGRQTARSPTRAAADLRWAIAQASSPLAKACLRRALERLEAEQAETTVFGKEGTDG